LTLAFGQDSTLASDRKSSLAFERESTLAFEDRNSTLAFEDQKSSFAFEDELDQTWGFKRHIRWREEFNLLKQSSKQRFKGCIEKDKEKGTKNSPEISGTSAEAGAFSRRDDPSAPPLDLEDAPFEPPDLFGAIECN